MKLIKCSLTRIKFLELIIVLSSCFCVVGCSLAERAEESNSNSDELTWPAVTRECRPWSRWWWLGSAVDKDNLTKLLAQYSKAGLGGVEICPIYGIKGLEESFVEFLSLKWIQMFEHTMKTAEEVDMGVDLTTGTGWPFGGPNVSDRIASGRLILKHYDLEGGDAFNSKLPEGKLLHLLAVSDKDVQFNLTDKVSEGKLDWTAPPGKWRIYALAEKRPIQRVKRAAPGGEGYVLDPFSVAALEEYLVRFDKAFSEYKGIKPRCHFHDSYEYYGADWTDDFFDEFKSRRGYDLLSQLPALFGDGSEDRVLRVKCDYRQTLSDLHLAYIHRWNRWCHENGSLSRNQAHGAPGNLIDIYAAADIPETEIFGEMHEGKIPLMKFSSSAAHAAGRPLASAESFTWLGEHFQVPLSDVKRAADFLFTAGVNHILFHGIPYSPAESPWPGRQFYAAVNFGPQGGLWRDLPQFNAYVTRCQSILQSGKSVNDILLYFPVHDLWNTSGELLIQFSAHHMQEDWVMSSTFYKAAMTLQQRGYTFDYVSDRLLAEADCKNGRLLLGENEYKIILVPKCQLMPIDTMQKLTRLARAGATVIFEKALPADVPGFGNLQMRRDRLEQLVMQAAMDEETFVVGEIETALNNSGLYREPCVDSGLVFVRRSHSEGFHYFLVNQNNKKVDGWIAFAAPAESAIIMDPLFENKIGLAQLRQSYNGLTQVFLQLQPGQSCILRTFTSKTADGPTWPYLHKDGMSHDIDGTWKVKFVEGGPELPAAFETQKLFSWTTLSDPEAQRFAGTARYTIEFDCPDVDADDWLLELGIVCESARVELNGKPAGVLWCEPFELLVGDLLQPGRNTLKIEVTNLAANRIRDLDRRKVNWKRFYDINFVNKAYRPFDASDWGLRDSGLLGPVRLQPLKKIATFE
jgi:hypothetical protein